MVLWVAASAAFAADVRVARVADLDGVEQTLRERIRNKLLPEAQVELDFIRGRPPLQANEANRKHAAYVRRKPI
ncbi:MAG TPA: hypothetical protein VHP37_11370 [Burkholderiales bacterium]|nr:hypothetical protein [Burkholderiales bacterium]